MALFSSDKGLIRCEVVRKTPSRGSVGLKFGLFTITGKGKISVPNSGKSQNNRGTSGPGRMSVTTTPDTLTGTAIVVKPFLKTANRCEAVSFGDRAVCTKVETIATSASGRTGVPFAKE